MLKGAQASVPGNDTQFVDLMTFVERPPDQLPRARERDRASWRSSRLKRIEAAAISMAGYRLVAALGATFRWRTEGIEHLEAVLRSGRQPIMAFWHGRILPATVYFRHRGIVVITSENFDGEWIAGIIERFGYGTARGSTSRGGLKALLQLSRDMAAGKSAAFTARRPARSGARRPARRGVAGEDDRQPCLAVSHRSRPPLDREQLGSHADPQAVRHRRAGDGRATPRTGRCRRRWPSKPRVSSWSRGCAGSKRARSRF